MPKDQDPLVALCPSDGRLPSKGLRNRCYTWGHLEPYTNTAGPGMNKDEDVAANKRSITSREGVHQIRPQKPKYPEETPN